ncbi:hypothetical protein GCM10010392_67360 [Streptomyces clavifer]|nr:hypothetical protein GCM10010392_67360 [Streptomyces clavifer]
MGSVGAGMTSHRMKPTPVSWPTMMNSRVSVLMLMRFLPLGWGMAGRTHLVGVRPFDVALRPGGRWGAGCS